MADNKNLKDELAVKKELTMEEENKALKKENEDLKKQVSGFKGLIKKLASDKAILAQKLTNVISANKAVSDAAEYTSSILSDNAATEARNLINSLQ